MKFEVSALSKYRIAKVVISYVCVWSTDLVLQNSRQSLHHITHFKTKSRQCYRIAPKRHDEPHRWVSTTRSISLDCLWQSQTINYPNDLDYHVIVIEIIIVIIIMACPVTDTTAHYVQHIIYSATSKEQQEMLILLIKLIQIHLRLHSPPTINLHSSSVNDSTNIFVILN